MASLYGTNTNDTLFGTSDDDLVIAMDGDDLLSSGSGGSDILDGGNGTDTATYASYNPGRYVHFHPEGINANLQTGIVQLPTRKDHPTSLFVPRPRNGGLRNIENLIGSNYNDTLIGNDDNNMLGGGAGSDSINGEGGNDTIYGDAGNDRVIGGAGDDELYGGSGDDTLDGSLGYDTLIGGDGNDTADYSLSPAKSVLVNLQTNQVGFPYANNRLMSITSVENVIGGSGDDWFIGNVANNQFIGGSGNDTLVGDGGHDNLVGDSGNDQLIGGTGNDWLDGGFGVDRLDGGDGVDTASYSFSTHGINADLETGVVRLPGQANETAVSIEHLIGSSSRDTVSGNNDTNWINGGLGDDDLFGRGSNDTLEGGDGNDVLGGDDGDDVVIGGLGDDYIMGGAGNDTLEGGSGQDTLFGGEGVDTVRIVGDVDDVYGSNDSLYIRVHQGAETDQLTGIEQINLVGSESNNSIFATNASVNVILEGMGGNDHMEGGQLNDTLYGGAGDDTLGGSKGTNQLYGGAGKDNFVLPYHEFGMDVVHDFSRTEDRLDMQDLKLSDLRVVYDGKDSVIYRKTKVSSTVNGRPQTSIIEAPRMRIKDAIVDSRDFVNVHGGTLQHLPLDQDARKNIGNLVREWAKDYARFRKMTFKDSPIKTDGNDPLLNTLDFKQSDMKLSNQNFSALPEFVAGQEAKVKTTAGGAVVFTYGYSTENTTETSISDAHAAGFSLGRTFSSEIGVLVGSVTVDTNFSVNYNYTRTESTSTGKTNGQSLEGTLYLNALPNSVMTARGGTKQQKGTADFITEMEVSGDVVLSFAKGTVDEKVSVPIDAILQTYLPGVFRGQGGVEQRTLPGGVLLAYNDKTVFTQAGSIKLSAYQTFYGEDHIVQDDSLLNTTQWTHEGEAHAENFWVVNGPSIPDRGVDSLTGEPVVLQISGFVADNTKFADKIGIFLDKDKNGTPDDGVDFLHLTKSMVQIAVTQQNYSQESTTVLQESTRISLGSKALVDLVGVKPNDIDSSNFIFSKAGTFFDDTIKSFVPGSNANLTGIPI